MHTNILNLLFCSEGLVGTVTEQQKQPSATKRIQFLPNTRTDTAPSTSTTISGNAPQSTQPQAREVATVEGVMEMDKERDAAASTEPPPPGTSSEGETPSEGASRADEVKEEVCPCT